MNKVKALLAFIWEEKYLFVLCFLLAFFAWQGINKNIAEEAEKLEKDKKIFIRQK